MWWKRARDWAPLLCLPLLFVLHLVQEPLPQRFVALSITNGSHAYPSQYFTVRLLPLECNFLSKVFDKEICFSTQDTVNCCNKWCEGGLWISAALQCFHFHLLHQLKKVWHQQLAVSVTGNHQCTTNIAPVSGCHPSLRFRSAIREVLLQQRLHVCLLHMYYRHNLVPRPHIRPRLWVDYITATFCTYVWNVAVM